MMQSVVGNSSSKKSKQQRDCIKLRGSATAYLFATIVAIVILFSASASNAAPQPPNDRCRPASKLEYNSARKQYLLRSRFGMYVRTGWALRRHYWYCQY
jgi:hypothetical protein